MKNKTLGTLALVGSPFLFIGLSYEQYMQIPAVGDTRFGGVYSFIYMAGWMCSLFGLLRLKAAGNSPFGRLVLWANILTLTLANIQNLAQVFLPGAIFHQIWLVLDIFWPISHLLMLIIGIAVIKAKTLAGWKRYAPLAIGLWLPIAFSTKFLPVDAHTTFYLMAFYTAVAWSMLAIAVRTTRENQEPEKATFGNYQTA